MFFQGEILTQTNELSQARQTVSDSVTKNGSEIIQGSKTFTDVDVEEAEVEHIDVEGEESLKIVHFLMSHSKSAYQLSEQCDSLTIKMPIF